MPSVEKIIIVTGQLILYRVNETESLINSHIYEPDCIKTCDDLPGLCNCGMENSCSRPRRGYPRGVAVFDTPYTFACTDVTFRYAVM